MRIPRDAPWYALLAAALALPAPARAQDVEGRAAKITFGGRVHVQYATTSADPDDDIAQGVFLRRARFIAEIEIGDRIEGRVQPDFAGGGASLQDAYLTLLVDRAFELSIGQFKRESELFDLSSSTDLPLVERDGRIPGVSTCAGVGRICTLDRLASNLEYSGRDIGLRAQGEIGSRFSYGITLTNGTGANEDDDNDAKSVSTRLAVEAADGVTVGGFLGLHDHLVDTGVDVDTEYAVAGGLDLEVGDWREGPHLLAGVVAGDNWRADADFLAAQLLGSWYLPLGGDLFEAWEPALRASWADGDRDAADDAGFLVTPGLFLYVTGKNRIGANLDVWAPQAGDTEVSFKVMTFLYF